MVIPGDTFSNFLGLKIYINSIYSERKPGTKFASKFQGKHPKSFKSQNMIQEKTSNPEICLGRNETSCPEYLPLIQNCACWTYRTD